MNRVQGTEFRITLRVLIACSEPQCTGKLIVSLVTGLQVSFPSIMLLFLTFHVCSSRFTALWNLLLLCERNKFRGQ